MASETLPGIVERVEERAGLKYQGFLLWKRSWWWVALARNGEVLATSEVYSSASKRTQTAVQVAYQLRVPLIAQATRETQHAERVPGF